MMTEISQQVRLGKTDIYIAPMGVGTWSWGDRTFWSYGVTHTDQDVQDAFDVCLNAGLNLIDTAAIYGFGKNERVLGKLLEKVDKPLIIASKLFPLPWLLTQGSLLRSVRGSINRLKYKPIDLYQPHWPLSILPVERWMDALAKAKELGLIRAIGVSNYNLKNMLRAKKQLEKDGLDLASNQVHFSLLHRQPELDGLLETCKQEGITLLAYSPLGQGLLTGKYKPGGVTPRGLMRLGNPKIIQRIQPLLEVMDQIGKAHGNKTFSQVAINWVLAKGAIPLVGAKNAHQAQENLGGLGWHLTETEVSTLDEASKEIQISFPMEHLAGLS
jgi:aryl-alcohol dehydrogenase-like predicted oxidoreductase